MFALASRNGSNATPISAVQPSDILAAAVQHRDGSLPEADIAALDLFAGRLSNESNISKEQAQDLIKRFGTDWETLLNEAHFVKELEGRLGQE